MPCSYGRHKVEGEAAIAARWPRHVILRPSIIYGPLPRHPIRRGLFLQFVDSTLAAQVRTRGPLPNHAAMSECTAGGSGGVSVCACGRAHPRLSPTLGSSQLRPFTCLQKPCTFFTDEWRTPTFINDLVAAVRAAVDRNGALPRRIYNVGGPARLNRHDMAVAVAQVRGSRVCVQNPHYFTRIADYQTVETLLQYLQHSAPVSSGSAAEQHFLFSEEACSGKGSTACC